MEHPWVALLRAVEVKAAASDGASQRAMQLPPPELGALATQVLSKYASMKEVITQALQCITPAKTAT